MKIDGVPIKKFEAFLEQAHSHDALPTVTKTTRSIPGRAGLKETSRKFGVKNFHLSIILKQRKNKKELQADIRKFMSFFYDQKGDPKTVSLEFDYEELFYFVSLEATTPVERIENAARITFHLMASNPYAYAKDTKAEVVGVAGKDSVVPLLSTQAAHFVQGSPVFAYPAIELEFEEDAAQYEITNETTGEILRVKWDFKAGDKLQVNFRNRRIEVNNVLRMNAWDYTTKFWKLRPGDNKIDADPVGKTYLSYRAVFL